MFVEVLGSAKIATKSLLYEQLTFANFFGIWLNSKLKIAKLTFTSYPLAQLLLSAMEKRETELLKHDQFLASLYLDPRYIMFISKIDQIVATQHLQQTWDRLKLLQQELPSDLSGTEVDSSKTLSTDDDLDILIKAREKAAEQNQKSFTSVIFTSNYAMQRDSIMVLLNSFANEPNWEKAKKFCNTWNNLKKVSGSYMDFLKQYWRFQRLKEKAFSDLK